MTAIAQAFSRAVQSAGEIDSLKLIAIFCGLGLLVSLAWLSYGLDLGPGLFLSGTGAATINNNYTVPGYFTRRPLKKPAFVVFCLMLAVSTCSAEF